MKKHGGMRPLDIPILLKISTMKDDFMLKDVADQLGISRSEVSESVSRSIYAGLLATDKKTVLKSALLEFLIYGLRYVFPQKPEAISTGIPTAHSAYPLSEKIASGDIYVWPHIDGTEKGQSITPLYHTVPDSCIKDAELYELLSLVEALRVGKARERELAAKELRKRI